MRDARGVAMSPPFLPVDLELQRVPGSCTRKNHLVIAPALWLIEAHTCDEARATRLCTRHSASSDCAAGLYSRDGQFARQLTRVSRQRAVLRLYQACLATTTRRSQIS